MVSALSLGLQPLAFAADHDGGKLSANEVPNHRKLQSTTTQVCITIKAKRRERCLAQTSLGNWHTVTSSFTGTSPSSSKRRLGAPTNQMMTDRETGTK